jgi:hypothetical protein
VPVEPDPLCGVKEGFTGKSPTLEVE